jgi:hypothetical protein
MSDEQRKDDETEVEGHSSTTDVNDESIEDPETEFEAHVQRTGNVRMDSPSNT